MDYQIKNFSDEFLEAQVEIGSAILSNWLGAQQTTLDRLRVAYAKDGFEPETKFYAIKDDKVVGFLTAGISDKVANMEFPVVLSNHPGAEKLLIEAAYRSFKNRGVTQVVSRASPNWGKTTEFVKEYGYEKKEILWISSRLAVEDYTLTTDTSDVKKIDLKKDLEEVKEILVVFREMEATAVDDYFNSLKKIMSRVINWCIIRYNGKIVGHDILVQDKFEPLKARMNAIYARGNNPEHIRDKIMSAHVKQARDAGVKYLDCFFFGPTEQLYRDYEKYGFEISDVTSYSKSL